MTSVLSTAATAVHLYLAPCYQAMCPVHLLVSASVGPTHSTTVSERLLVVLLSCWTAQLWAPPTSSQLFRSELLRGIRQQWSGGCEVESEVRGGSWSSLGSSPAYPDLGQWVSWGAQRTSLGLCSVGLQSPHLGHPLVLAQALRQW